MNLCEEKPTTTTTSRRRRRRRLASRSTVDVSDPPRAGFLLSDLILLSSTRHPTCPPVLRASAWIVGEYYDFYGEEDDEDEEDEDDDDEDGNEKEQGEEEKATAAAENENKEDDTNTNGAKKPEKSSDKAIKKLEWVHGIVQNLLVPRAGLLLDGKVRAAYATAVGKLTVWVSHCVSSIDLTPDLKEQSESLISIARDYLPQLGTGAKSNEASKAVRQRQWLCRNIIHVDIKAPRAGASSKPGSPANVSTAPSADVRRSARGGGVCDTHDRSWRARGCNSYGNQASSRASAGYGSCSRRTRFR